ncbi:MAG TPA: hypothetical protein VFN01_00540 [Marinobacter sp.]|uniref:hypothetical protein n=1 Tax=Marinobacter sp. TaxID=50741 RepID=UPI002D7EC6D9|nr:hypothetical protein [Marinobacter sp.]HET8799645.1 hypothetical protein [Marinobacter sp.]
MTVKLRAPNSVNQEPLDDAVNLAFKELADRHSDKYPHEQSIESRIGNALHVLAHPDSGSGKAAQNMMWPLTVILPGEGEQFAKDFLTDILVTLLDRLPQQDLTYIHTKLKTRLASCSQVQQCSDNYHTHPGTRSLQRGSARAEQPFEGGSHPERPGTSKSSDP